MGDGRWEMEDGSVSSNEKEKAGDVMELQKSIYLIICGCENPSSYTGSVEFPLIFWWM